MKGKCIFNPIGTTFKEGKVILTPKDIPNGGTSCKGCWYNTIVNKKANYTKSCSTHGHACTPFRRADKKQVIFVEV